MTRNDLRNEYFEWLSDLVCGDRYSKQISYRKLLMHLHNTEFRYLLEMDKNRADEGINLRYHFALDNGYRDSSDIIIDLLDGPCTVLEMMVALAMYCEKHIMDDTSYGDRTGQWFWDMISNLGLGSMTDKRYDRRYVEDVLEQFMDRKYEPNGKGGLFTIRNCDIDLRDVEIFYQLCWYLNTIT